MPRALILALFRALVLVALAVSSALLYDYTRPVPAFCASGTGCDTVRQSQFATFAGVPTPVIGVIAFVALFATTLLDHERRKSLMFGTAQLGAIAGLGFLAVQEFMLHTFCKLCVVVDVSVVIAAGVAFWYRYKGDHGTDGAVPGKVWGAAALVAVVAPLLFGSLQPTPPVKPSIARLWQPGKINIVEMSDFQCPYCRMLHPQLKTAVESFGDRVNFVRISVALPGHTLARPASRMYLCASDQGKGEQAAHHLFTTDLSKVDAESVAEELRSTGLDVDKFKRCAIDPATDARVTADFKRAHDEIGFEGLPTTWIGTQTILGARPAEDIRRVIEAEEKGSASNRIAVPPSWMWTALMLGIAAIAGLSAFRAKRQS